MIHPGAFCVLAAGAEGSAFGVIENAAYHFFGIAVAQLPKAQGPDMVALCQVAEFDKHLEIGGIIAQHT